MPRVWTLKKVCAVQPSIQSDLAITNYENTRQSSAFQSVSDQFGAVQQKKSNDDDTITQAEQFKMQKNSNLRAQSMMSPALSQSFSSGVTPKPSKMKNIMPTDSTVVKEGELLKIGKRTGTMRNRYYILRDQTLFFYNNKG